MPIAPPDATALNDAALLGLAAGLRTASPLAALALRGRLGAGRLAGAAPLLLAGELVADKLPFIPARTSPPGLAARIASGATAGHVRGGPQAAIVAAALAVVSAYGGQHTRQWLVRRTGRSDLQVALTEDVLALGLAAAGARRGAG